MAIEISTLEELQVINNDINGDYELTNIIDAYDTQTWNWDEENEIYKGFEPIGDSTFDGIFDGQWFIIDNLYIDRSNESHTGLIKGLAGILRRVKIENCDIIGV